MFILVVKYGGKLSTPDTVCDISLDQRAELLEQMVNRGKQLKIQRKQQVKESEAARHRNATLLQVGRL